MNRDLYEQLTTNDNGQSLWHLSRNLLQRSFETSGLVLLTLIERESLEAGWIGTYLGIVVDVGHQNDQHWIDVRFTSHIRLNDDALGAVDNNTRFSLWNAITGADTTVPDNELKQKLTEAQMSADVQEVIGNRQSLEVPEGIQRLDVTTLGAACVALLQRAAD